MKTLIIEDIDNNSYISDNVEKLIWNLDADILFLSKKLKYLEVNNTQTLNTLPDGLETLICNKVRSLPYKLPEKLKYLEANSVFVLNTLPDELETLICNKVRSLPCRLPRKLKHLEINNVHTLNTLPDGLETLICNKVRSLPYKLPEKLKYLEANNLLSIGALPSGLVKLKTPKLKHFYDNRNWLYKLLFNYFPSSLKELSVGNIRHWISIPKKCTIILNGKSERFKYVMSKLNTDNTIITNFKN